MKKAGVNIPKPCHEDWNSMVPDARGRYCASCKKTVVDFTSMTDKEIETYFLLNAHQKTCGHFKVSQTINAQPFVHRQLIQLHDFIQSGRNTNLFRNSCLFLIGACMTLIGCRSSVDGERIPDPNGKPNNSEQKMTGDSTYTQPKDSIKSPERTKTGVIEKLQKDLK